MSETNPTDDGRTRDDDRTTHSRADGRAAAREPSPRPCRTDQDGHQGREQSPEPCSGRSRDRPPTGTRTERDRPASVTDGGVEVPGSRLVPRRSQIGALGPACREWFLRVVHELERTPTGMMLLHAGAITIVFVVFAASIGTIQSGEAHGEVLPVDLLFQMTHDWILSLYLLYLATVLTVFLWINGARLCHRIVSGHDLSESVRGDRPHDGPDGETEVDGVPTAGEDDRWLHRS